MSIAQQHKRKVLAEKAKQQTDDKQNQANFATTANNKKQAETEPSIKNQLPEDLNILKALNGDEERNGYKVELIEKYRDYAEAQHNKSNWGGDNLLSNWFMWQLDVRGIEAMWQQMINAIEHGISGPNQIKRDMATLFLDAVHDFTAGGLNSEKEFNTDIIKQAITDLNTGNYVTNSALKSKLLALHGKVLFSEMDYEKAIKSFEQATQLNPKAGVKTLLKEAKQKLTGDSENDDS